MRRRPPWLADLAVALAVSALALAPRLPFLQEIPRLTDETGEVRAAMDIAWEGARPLVHNDAYRGPAWAYALAGALALAGPRPELPRDYAALLGALTVGATYLLGAALAGRRAGLLAALLVGTAFGPVALWSHVAWSNHATPLAVLLAALLTVLGAGPGRRGEVALVAAGLAWGLALHTHPSAVAPLLGALGWWLADAARRARLRRPAPWLALGLGLLALSPILVHNVRQPLASLREAGASGQPLAGVAGPGDLAGRWLALAAQLGRSAGAGPLAEAADPAPDGLVRATDGLRPLATWLYAAAYLGALAWAAWRGPRLLAWLGGATLLLLPLLNRNYESFYDQRYLGLLLPLGAVALGAWAAARWEGAARGGRLALAAGLAVLALYPLASLGAYYTRELAAGRTNGPLLAATARLAAAPPAGGGQVFVDKALADLDLGGGGDPARAFVHLLTLAGLPNTRADAAKIRWFLANDRQSRLWVIAGAQAAADLGAEFGLAPVAGGEGWVLLERPADPAGR